MGTANNPRPGEVDGPPAAPFLASGSATGTWTLDPAASRVEFHSTSMWGMAKVHGRFATVSGEGTVGPDGTVTGELTVDANSLDTKLKKRDTHLRSKDFFDVTRHPTITYSVERISPLDANRIEVLGEITVLGQREPLTFTATVTEATASAVTVEAELNVDRSRFGMTWSPLKVASMNNRIVVSVRFLRADS